ncbi:MAG: tyrosine-type recombinase/integrase [Methylobacter sp.]
MYLRGKIWWIQFTAPDGTKVQRSSGTKLRQEAQEFHDRLKAESWRIKHLGAKRRYTWHDAVIRWLTEQNHKKSIETDKVHLRWLDKHLSSFTLDQISKAKIDAIKSARLADGVSNSTVNRMLSILRSILNRAKDDWEWIDTVPGFRFLPEPPGRVRWITRDESVRLINELPEHLKFMVRFSLATGLRESNVTHLQWSHVDMNRRCAWVLADQAKAGKAIPVPLNDDAIEILAEQVGKHDVRVFTYKGNVVNDGNTKAFRKALKRAGIEDFRWHDLRHTWASWHVQNGTPLHVLKELGGWADISMVLKYAHLSGGHLEKYVQNSLQVRDKSTT